MDKPRVIIAETDFSYIVPLQQRFIEKFADKIDLEIIDNKVYFDKLFSSPQRADVLVVCEELYDSSVRIHNIGHIFVLSEQLLDEPPTDRNVITVFKYTNIKDVFNRISGPIAPADEKREPEIIVVSSASGGVGKTTVALGLCGCLTRSFKKVLYINASRLQSFQHFFENGGAISSPDVYARLSHENSMLFANIRHVIRTESFSYLPPFKMALLSLGIPYSVFGTIAAQAKESNEYDYIVVDTDSAFDDSNARLMGMADKVLLITDQTLSAVYATNLLVENISGVTGEKYFFICNRFDKEDQNALIQPSMHLRFTVNEYIDRFYNYDSMRCDDFAQESSIERVAMLVM